MHIYYCIITYYTITYEGFFGFAKTFGRTQKNKKAKPISKGESETFKNFVYIYIYIYIHVYLYYY